VELKQCVGDSPERQTLVSRLIEQTQASRKAKKHRAERSETASRGSRLPPDQQRRGDHGRGAAARMY
jgi:hypothetical protein